MKICFVCNEYPPGIHGGIGTAIKLLSCALVQQGHEVRVVGIYSDADPSSENVEGVKVIRLKETRTTYPFHWIVDRIQLYKYIKKLVDDHEIDLVEVPDWQGLAAFWPKLRVPVVVRLNGSCSYFQNEIGLPSNRMTFLLERVSLHRSDACCSVSRYTAEKTRHLFKLHSKAIDIISNPVEFPNPINEFKYRSLQKVIYTGTLTFKKGVISLIDAWSIVIKDFPDSKLEIYGKDGSYGHGLSMRQYLESRIDKKDSVRFFGHVGREIIFNALSTARLAVFPSYAEAFALAPLEAMAFGCPTIISRLGAGKELIEDGVNGLLVDPKNPQEIASAIISILSNDQKAEQLSRLGRERIEKYFSLSQILPKNIEFYQKTIEEFKSKTQRVEVIL